MRSCSKKWPPRIAQTNMPAARCGRLFFFEAFEYSTPTVQNAVKNLASIRLTALLNNPCSILHRLKCGILADISRQPSEHAGGDIAVKLRLDKLLLERGLVTTRQRAQSLILAGKSSGRWSESRKSRNRCRSRCGSAIARRRSQIREPRRSQTGEEPSTTGTSMSRIRSVSTLELPPAALPIACCNVALRA